MKKLLLIAFLGSILVSCNSVEVRSDFDPSVDFTQFKSLEYYGWAEDSDRILSRFDKERIEVAAGDEFKKRGIEVVESGGDLVVTLFVVTQDKTRVTASTTGVGMSGMGGYGGYGGAYGYGPGWGYGGGYGGMSTAQTTYREHDYVVGTLAISVYDKSNEKLIWEGVAEGTVDDNPQNREKTIPSAIAKIMATYPVNPM